MGAPDCAAVCPGGMAAGKARTRRCGRDRRLTMMLVPGDVPGGRLGRRDQEASFFTVIVWRDQAEHAAESLSKGCRVVVVGRLQQRSWTAEDAAPGPRLRS